jgi:hypothetical protein
VEIVEQGVGTIFQQMLQLQTDVDGLDSVHAEMFRKLSSDLYSGESADPMQAAIERNDLLQHIRKQPGSEYFLLPKPYDVLRNVAQGGPIVILNSHEDGCEGMIILKTSEPVHVAFPKVKLANVQSQQSMLKELLGLCSSRMRGKPVESRLSEHEGVFQRLWTSVVSPVNSRLRGQPVPSRLAAQREGAISKPPKECFEELFHWLWMCIVSPVYEVLKSVSTCLVL